VAAVATTAATAAETAATTAAAETAAAAGVVVVWATEAKAAAAAAAAATSEHRVALVLRLVPRHRLSAHRDRVSAAVVRRHGCEHWLALAGVAFERHQPPGLGLYTRLCGAPPPAAEVVEQIELDVARTNVGEGEAGEGEAGEGAAGAAEARRAALRRVLLAWARHDAGTGYVQGMDTIAAAALLPSAAACPSLGEGNEAVEEAAFWWLSYAVRSVRDPTATPAPAPAPAPALTLTLGVGLARCTACSRASMRRAWAGCGRSSAASAARSAWRTPASPRTSRASASTWPSSALAGTSPTPARAPSPQAEAKPFAPALPLIRNLSQALAPTRYLTLFTRILPRAEVGAALAALAARTLAPTHLALGVLLARCDAAHSFSDPNRNPDPLTLTLTLTP